MSSTRIALVGLLVGVWALPAAATKYVTAPRPGFILRTPPAVLAFSSTTAVTLYDLTGQPLRTFDLGARVGTIDVSTDERYVALAGDGGRVRVWEVDDGTLLANVVVPGGQRHTCASFSPDGSAFCAASSSGVMSYRVRDGSLIGQLDLGGAPEFVAVQSGGETGFALLHERVHEFDVRGGRVTPLAGTGASPLRLTADGRYALMQSDNDGVDEFLRVLDTRTGGVARLHGPLDRIQRIRPTADGTVRVTASSSKSGPGGQYFEAGYRYDPATDAIRELWRVQTDTHDGWAADFDPDRGLGVMTGASLHTRVFDLKTGAIVLTIDNSANGELELLSSSAPGRYGPPSVWSRWLVRFLPAATVVVVVAVLLVRRRRRRTLRT